MSGTPYVVISLFALAVVALAVIFAGQGRRGRLTPLTGIALACVVAGIVLGDNQWIGYTLIGLGVALAGTDIILRSRRSP